MELKRPFSEDYVSKRHMKGSKENPISDAELRRKKKIQSRLSLGGSVAGLTGLGAITTAAVVRKKPKLLMVKPENATKVADSLKDKGYVAGSVAGGIGGIGGINFAAIQREESRRRVRKSYNAYTGTETTKYTPRTAKRSPNPEVKREKRQKYYTPAAAGAGAGLIAGSKKIGEYTEKANVKSTNFANARERSGYEQSYRAAQNSNAQAQAEQTEATRAARSARGKLGAVRRRAPREIREPVLGPNGQPAMNGRQPVIRTMPPNPEEINVHRQEMNAAREAVDNAVSAEGTAGRRVQSARNAEQVAANEMQAANARYPNVTRSPKAYKAGKYGSVAVGGALIGAAIGNEIHRRKSGKSYKGYFDQYKN